jgi:hypothetical protein
MGKINDVAGETSITRVVDPAAVTTTAALGQVIDLQGFQGRIKLALAIGAVTGTTPTLDIKVQDCDTSGGTYADVSPATAFAQKVTASANTVDSLAVDTRAVRRYVKLYATAGGTTPSFTLGITAIGQKQTI